jgi:crossover junction endodeoxyribonuclease RusA
MTSPAPIPARVRIELGWPAKALSPNARVHRMVKARAVKKARLEAEWAATIAGGKQFKAERVIAHITFHPPIQRGRKPDEDNLLASVKAQIDGIAKIIGVDDSKWSFRLDRAESVPGGAVTVELEGVDG